jgi:Uridine kinase
MSVALALGFSVKIPMLFALPLILVYLYRNIQRDRFKIIATSIASFLGVVFFISAPFTFSLSYISMVYLNPQQSLLYDLSLNMGNYQLYVAYLAVLVIYARFLMYEKVNKDLLHNFLAVVYSVFVLLVPPSENWYVWSFVLCSVLFISLLDRVKIAYALSALFSTMYLITFLYAPYLENLQHKNLVFTTFEGVLMFVVYVLYKYGIKSNRVYKKKEHATLIGIGGDSGVGKTTVKQSIVQLLGAENIVPIESDGDHKWGRGDQSWENITHLNPKANYLYRQAQYLKALKNGSNIERVEYNHDTGGFSEPLKVYANDFIIVAGLHPFYLPQTRKLIDIKIYLDTQESLRRHWKIRRDIATRGYSADQITAQIEAREEDAQLYIHPQMNYADLIIQFFTDDLFQVGSDDNPRLKLKIKLSLDVEVEGILERIQEIGFESTHLYDTDMSFQHIIFESEVPKDVLKLIAENYIENIDELINGHEIIWKNGYQGMIQLFTLILLSHHFKKGEENEL